MHAYDEFEVSRLSSRDLQGGMRFHVWIFNIGAVPHQKAVYLAAKRKLQSYTFHGTEDMLHSLLDDSVQSQNFGCNALTCSMTSSNKCFSASSAGPQSPHSPMQKISEVQEKNTSLQSSSQHPIFGVASCASCIKSSSPEACQAEYSVSPTRSATDADQAKKCSKRAASDAINITEKPRKQLATVNTQSGRKKVTQNLAILFEREE